MEKLVRIMKWNAELGILSGIIHSKYEDMYKGACSHFHRHTGTRILFTRDSGYHSCGWWKNPDYERCYHLSLSFRDPLTLNSRPYDKKLAAQWTRAFFGYDEVLTWCEPPFSPEGKAVGVHHYRLFCDPAWKPIKPRGEVYNTEFTEKGFKSFSEIHGQKDTQNESS